MVFQTASQQKRHRKTKQHLNKKDQIEEDDAACLARNFERVRKYLDEVNYQKLDHVIEIDLSDKEHGAKFFSDAQKDGQICTLMKQ